MNSENLRVDLSVSAEIKLYYDLYIPETAETGAPLLIAVHGYGAHKRYMMREAFVAAPENFVIASIQAPHQHFRQTEKGYKTGFGWLTDFKSEESIKIHHNFILEIIGRLTESQTIDARNVYLYGFSQACALNFRFAFTFPNAVRGVIAIGGGVPSDMANSEIYQPTAADVFYLYGNDDEFYSAENFRDYEQKLRNYLPNFQSKIYEAKHEITGEMRDDIKEWLAQRDSN